MCWYVPICADMCRHVPKCDINLDTSDSDLIYMPACVSTCGHADMCWYVPTCADTWNHPQHLWYQPLEIYLECWHVSTHLDMPTCAEMCRHVPTCDNNIDTSYSNHLDLIWMWACVSICGHAGMCWYVSTCGEMWNHFQHLWYQPFETYLACWHVSANWDMPMCADMCRHVLTCADMYRHVPTCDINHDTSYSDHLDLIWMLACVSICGHAGMCWYVPTCAGMCEHVKPLSAPLIPTIWNLSCMLACVSKLGHADVCWYVPACAGMCWHVPTCANMWH